MTKVVKDHNTSLFSVRHSPPYVKRIHSIWENSLFEDDKRRKLNEVCFGVMNSDLFPISKFRFLRGKKPRNRVKVVLALSKSDFFRIRKICSKFRNPFEIILAPWNSDFFPIPKIRFFRASKHRQLLQVSFCAITNRFISYTENSRFQEFKRPETMSRLFWSHEKRFFTHSENLLFSALKRYKSHQVCLGTMKKPFLPD